MPRRRILAALAALLTALVGVTIIVTDNGPDHPPDTPRRTVTVQLGGPGHSHVTLDPSAQAALDDAAAAPPGEDALHETATPSAGQLHAGNQLAPAGQPPIPNVPPQAAPTVRGCRTTLVRNYSSRNGAKPVLGVIHWTGSWAPGPAIVRWFDTPAAEASSNEITDQAGHCWLAVPEYFKAWTQAAANPWAVSVEIINPGVLPLFRAGAARGVVLTLMRGWHHRWGIPYQRGAVNSSCVPTRPGFLAHRDLGQCGGGHPDVGATDLGALIHQAAAGDPGNARAARRRDHVQVHKRRRELGCAHPARVARHPAACKKLAARNRALHKAGL